MGCAAATPQAAEKFVPTVKIKMPSSAETRVRPSLVDDIVNLKFSQSDMVRENKSKILREYNILTPLLGRGSFGEVRKALHKPTGMYRAVKIIDKRGAAKDQLDRIQKEVSILNQLV
jgi:serine/threonine protein kinase